LLQFGDAIRALNGKQVKLRGYITPLAPQFSPRVLSAGCLLRIADFCLSMAHFIDRIAVLSNVSQNGERAGHVLPGTGHFRVQLVHVVVVSRRSARAASAASSADLLPPP
jgi:hypothetical protein